MPGAGPDEPGHQPGELVCGVGAFPRAAPARAAPLCCAAPSPSGSAPPREPCELARLRVARAHKRHCRELVAHGVAFEPGRANPAMRRSRPCATAWRGTARACRRGRRRRSGTPRGHTWDHADDRVLIDAARGHARPPVRTFCGGRGAVRGSEGRRCGWRPDPRTGRRRAIHPAEEP